MRALNLLRHILSLLFASASLLFFGWPQQHHSNTPFVIASPVKEQISCLVEKSPGEPLTSEPCPADTVGCRLRINEPLKFPSTANSKAALSSPLPSSLISFYPSATKDQNQFVCVLRHEYGPASAKTSGGSGGGSCIRRGIAGRLRCWCGSSSDCNTMENSIRIYREFLASEVEAGGRASMEVAEKPSKAPKLAAEEPKMEKQHPKAKLAKGRKKEGALHPAAVSTNKDSLRTTEATLEMKDKAQVQHINKGAADHKQRSRHDPLPTTPTTTSPTDTFVEDVSTVGMVTSNEQEQQQPVRSEYDGHNHVHIIHVTSGADRNRYESLLGSEQFATVMRNATNEIHQRQKQHLGYKTHRWRDSDNDDNHHEQHEEDDEWLDGDDAESSSDSATDPDTGTRSSEHSSVDESYEEDGEEAGSAKRRWMEGRGELSRDEEHFDSAFYSSASAIHTNRNLAIFYAYALTGYILAIAYFTPNIALIPALI